MSNLVCCACKYYTHTQGTLSYYSPRPEWADACEQKLAELGVDINATSVEELLASSGGNRPLEQNKGDINV